MNYHHQRARVEIPDALDSAGVKLVYLSLRIEGEATIDELQAALGLKRITLYPLLKTLTTTDLVERSGVTYRCREPASHEDDR
ncbi:TrmB family transcriptional regulator [Halalkalicoccus sp. NIPERK01]|uniref:TrmB family transcriptional regulator n=1 Tax=Halalkalicoccus sp. NIPERK01 TaxID=3053469 RepID=UPI00256EEC72|nr:TrmB family transcriptional regulator [Halalkalicoccus sp. NIPERK01]MDL5362233.1 TrmB family transcriptional regulator [Halalkalicoccus sp. NIPERK01]